jgi:hypothetical protein
MWRTITDHDAVELTKQRHRDIYAALRAGNPEQASAADLVHLADGELWLERWLDRERALWPESEAAPTRTLPARKQRRRRTTVARG